MMRISAATRCSYGMDPALLARLEKLTAAGIELVPLPGLNRHYVLARDGFAALVERNAGGFGRVGAAGQVNERGFAALVWRGEAAWFVGKNFETPAAPEDVERLRLFASDLKKALTSNDD